MLNTVIFDMDGLLVNSEPLWALAMKEVFATVGVDISPELARKTTGLRTSEVVSFWHDHFKWEAKSAEQVSEEIVDSVTSKIISEGGAMDGLHYILDFFKDKNFKIGLASSSPLKLITSVLEHLKIKDRFEAIASAEFEPFGKPHPAVYLACAQQLKSVPLHCLAFEDSINGMVAAKAARMRVVAVPEEHNASDQRFALADLQLPSLSTFNERHFKMLNEF